MENTIQENIRHIMERINTACKKAGRDPKEVQLLLATKTVEPERILQAFSCGCTLIGENKVQELHDKYEALSAVPHTAHFIGHLQSNKIKEVIRYVQCIQSIDNLDTAQKLEQRLAQEGRSIEILVQVNTSAEESKFGCKPGDAENLVKAIAALPHLNIRGFMTIGLFSGEEDKVRACFRCLKHVQKQVAEMKLPNISTDVLSMGMSGDLEIAIEEGSTMLRIGTAVFGERHYPDTHYWPA
ncbi:YggS family pyridoxal phosphate-dependent enzyme [Treponema vincentii]|uniref:YggS family pyridoxal phosphate-dependent enzyme n=1 Tax=Treponema vincentii TaxID=69710 RepID=UPI003D91668A